MANYSTLGAVSFLDLIRGVRRRVTVQPSIMPKAPERMSTTIARADDSAAIAEGIRGLQYGIAKLNTSINYFKRYQSTKNPAHKQQAIAFYHNALSAMESVL